jgi:hypothetical protein
VTDHKYDRLYRPVDSSFFPVAGIVAMLDSENNIVYFNKDVFDYLEPYQQAMIYRLQDRFLELDTTTN